MVPPTDRAPPRPPSDVMAAFEGHHRGRSWSVRAFAHPGASSSDLEAMIRDELHTLSVSADRSDPASEISRFNAAPSGVWALSEPFWNVLNAAMDLADDTDGAVDPTLGALVDCWRASTTPPGEDEIEVALSVCGWQSLRLNPQAQAAMQPGGLMLDLAAILDGHTVDRISERLAALGATSHLIKIGGVVRGMGVKPDAQPWWVEVGQPSAGAMPPTVAALFDLAMATARETRTLDRRTGRPVDNNLVAVTVLHTSARHADALATALMVMGPYDGPAYAEALGLAVQFIERTPRGLTERLSPAFSAMLDDDD